MVFSKRIAKWQAKKKYLKFPNKLQQQKYRTSPKKLMHRPKVGILKAKWLEEFKLKKKLKVITKFVKRNIGKCYKITAR